MLDSSRSFLTLPSMIFFHCCLLVPRCSAPFCNWIFFNFFVKHSYNNRPPTSPTDICTKGCLNEPLPALVNSSAALNSCSLGIHRCLSSAWKFAVPSYASDPQDFHRYLSYFLLLHFSSPPQVKKSTGEKIIAFHMPKSNSSHDEVASYLRQKLHGFGELVLALLAYQLPKPSVLLAPQSFHFSLLGSQVVLKTILMAIIHLPVFGRLQLSITLFERTDGQSFVSTGHKKQHTESKS